MPNKLLPLNKYGDREMTRLMGALEDLSFNVQEHAAILRDIKAWLDGGVQAPTVSETRQQKLTPGWYCKRFGTFVVEGDEGSMHISRLISKQGLHQWKGTDLDTWKSASNPIPPPKAGSIDLATALLGPED